MWLWHFQHFRFCACNYYANIIALPEDPCHEFLCNGARLWSTIFKIDVSPQPSPPCGHHHSVVCVCVLCIYVLWLIPSLSLIHSPSPLSLWPLSICSKGDQNEDTRTVSKIKIKLKFVEMESNVDPSMTVLYIRPGDKWLVVKDWTNAPTFLFSLKCQN